jgi:alkanesulfonate monooxygenase SsuD/methylene tetrahydromethanopterin reductase-like flavin-dependent oxidoreductase (luciferase family)
MQKPHPPIHVGGAFPYDPRRVIRYGDGWIPTARGDVAEVLPNQARSIWSASAAASR